ncbi:hypothetical protein [uncultured Photobacterium sp.]|uniref:hypothetical protein n=1 Tax=uncultured Photobacterium sp. TaxID=173973 RepID=UPI002609D21C|nr:hypothetical protein [uncultured Photobacterium sp.]
MNLLALFGKWQTKKSPLKKGGSFTNNRKNKKWYHRRISAVVHQVVFDNRAHFLSLSRQIAKDYTPIFCERKRLRYLFILWEFMHKSVLWLNVVFCL